MNPNRGPQPDVGRNRQLHRRCLNFSSGLVRTDSFNEGFLDLSKTVDPPPLIVFDDGLDAITDGQQSRLNAALHSAVQLWACRRFVVKRVRRRGKDEVGEDIDRRQQS